MIMRQIAAHMRVQQPMHPAAQIAILTGPDSEMEMIGHETIADQPHRDAEPGFTDQSEEALVVPRLAEDSGAGIATIQDMVAITSR
jgi:hypothetical protein